MAPKRIADQSTQVGVRLGQIALDRAAALIQPLSPPGLTLTRADVLRAAIDRGLDALEAEVKTKKRK